VVLIVLNFRLINCTFVHNIILYTIIYMYVLTILRISPHPCLGPYDHSYSFYHTTLAEKWTVSWNTITGQSLANFLNVPAAPMLISEERSTTWVSIILYDYLPNWYLFFRGNCPHTFNNDARGLMPAAMIEYT